MTGTIGPDTNPPGAYERAAGSGVGANRTGAPKLPPVVKPAGAAKPPRTGAPKPAAGLTGPEL